MRARYPDLPIQVSRRNLPRETGGRPFGVAILHPRFRTWQLRGTKLTFTQSPLLRTLPSRLYAGYDVFRFSLFEPMY